ncbi:MAG: SDR family NAD(P)-dependent oxidoreductase [Candidatus Hydrogenedentes bacterium]|nr:SDR family NAD(P)-dependent oxidoreductase [Candidatus Hydrogenedentota bacterium]
MAKRFENKNAFITGGSSGIGAALGVAFAREGARVALAARSLDRLAESVHSVEEAGGSAIALQCDVTSRASIDEAVERAVEEFGGLDVVVANAGFGVDGLMTKLETEDYRRQFETNVFGVIDTVYATLPHLVESKGRLAIVSSVLGKIGRPAMSAYAASKFAVCGFAESIYYELADLGISVTCVNPGLVESNFRVVDNEGRFHEEWTDPAPQFFVMPAERAARDIVRAIYKRRFEANVTLHGKFGIFMNRHFPWMVRTAQRQLTRGRLHDFDRSAREKES